MLNKKFIQWGLCDENVAVDETMVGYYGKSSLKQFIRGKPIRFGFKKWTLAGSSGYCYQSDLYVGKSLERRNKPLGSHVVLSLVATAIEDANSHCLYFDNFFTSLELLNELRDIGLRATGTIRKNRTRGAPLLSDKDMKKAGRGSVDSLYHTSHDVLLVKWFDNSPVIVATNHDTVTRRTSQGRTSVQQPKVINAYNQHMGGVDKFDQQVSTYR